MEMIGQKNNPENSPYMSDLSHPYCLQLTLSLPVCSATRTLFLQCVLSSILDNPLLNTHPPLSGRKLSLSYSVCP